MPTVNSATLTLTTRDQTVEVEVEYEVSITSFERQLCELGMGIHSHVDLLGVDAGGHTVLTTFPRDELSVTANTPQPMTRKLSMGLPRSALQEDTGLGDADEISVNVRLHSYGIPPELTPDFFSPQKVLLG